jgi:hypothetical protein
MLSRWYMNTSIRKQGRYRGWRRNTETEYSHLVKESIAPRLPLFASLICIPVGLALLIGAIIYSNHLRIK